MHCSGKQQQNTEEGRAGTERVSSNKAVHPPPLAKKRAKRAHAPAALGVESRTHAGTRAPGHKHTKHTQNSCPPSKLPHEHQPIIPDNNSKRTATTRSICEAHPFWDRESYPHIPNMPSIEFAERTPCSGDRESSFFYVSYPHTKHAFQIWCQVRLRKAQPRSTNPPFPKNTFNDALQHQRSYVLHVYS